MHLVELVVKTRVRAGVSSGGGLGSAGEITSYTKLHFYFKCMMYLCLRILITSYISSGHGFAVPLYT